MILEIALLNVIPARTAEFERAFGEAKAIIASMRGFRGLELQRCLEVSNRGPNRYALLVRWETLEDHTVGFRGSPEYQKWRALLHHFYDPFPVVEHYEEVHRA